jgi:WD40 repeat protein
VLPKDFVLLSPDGRNVLTKGNEPEDDPISTIWAYPVDGGEPKKVLQNPPDNIYWAEYADDGKNLAMVQGRVISNLILFTRSKN